MEEIRENKLVKYRVIIKCDRTIHIFFSYFMLKWKVMKRYGVVCINFDEGL